MYFSVFLKLALFIFSLGMVSIVSIVDYEFQYHLSLSIIYMIPIGLVSWFLGKFPGMGLAIFCILNWTYGHELLSHESIDVSSIVGINILHLTIFYLTTLSIYHIRKRLLYAEKMSLVDDLTGLFNHRAFYESAETEVYRSERHQSPFSLVYMDLDNFKAVNDQFGHYAGDEALQITAELMKDSFRKTDICARIGGDEFTILLPETDSQRSQSIMERFQQHLKQKMSERNWPITCSIGIMTFQSYSLEIKDMLQQVDQLMYQAKKSDKNKIVSSFYSDSKKANGVNHD